MSLNNPQELLNGFYYQDKNNVLQKLNYFAAAGKDKLHIVADFDHTLTSGISNGDNMGTWDVFDVLLPPDGVKKHNDIYQSLRPLELADKLTNEIAAEKWSAALDLICEYQLNIDEIESAFLSISKLRSGAKQLFDTCKRNNIPIIVLSAGIKNVIELMADYYNIEPDVIISTELEINKNRQIIGWQKETFVHALNKNEQGHHELYKLSRNRPNIILLGDSLDDVNMVTGKNNVIRIRVLDARKDEMINLKTELQNSFNASYDLAVENSIAPVARVINWLG